MRASASVIITTPHDVQGCRVPAVDLGQGRYQLLGMPACAAGVHQHDVVEAQTRKGYDHPVVSLVVQRGDYVTYGLDYNSVCDKQRFEAELDHLHHESDTDSIGAHTAWRGMARVSVKRAKGENLMRYLEAAFPNLIVFAPSSRYESAFHHVSAPRARNPLSFTSRHVLALFPWLR